MSPPRLVLASASPRRADLLARAGLAFAIEPADVDERTEPGEAPEVAAVRLAEQKARAVAQRHRGERAAVLGADTIVAVPSGPDGGVRLLGKPDDRREAGDMLRALSGSRHAVVTGVCAIDAATGARHAAFERTWVRMRVILPAEIEAYLDSGEWRGKAGAYAIQESADRFVTGLEEGGFDNVVGLPVRLALELLARAGVAIAGTAG